MERIPCGQAEHGNFAWLAWFQTQYWLCHCFTFFIAWYGGTIGCLTIHLRKDIWNDSNFWLSWIIAMNVYGQAFAWTSCVFLLSLFKFVSFAIGLPILLIFSSSLIRSFSLLLFCFQFQWFLLLLLSLFSFCYFGFILLSFFSYVLEVGT